MAISNTVIQIKKSGVTGNVPSSLGAGELALNYVDNKLFYKNASGGTSWFYGANNGPSFSTVSNGTSLITATAPNDTLTFATANGITITSNSSSKIITVGLSGITSTPTLNITGNIPTISTTTGSLIVTGGVGVSGNVYANGIYAVSALYANGISVSGGGGTSTFPTLNVTGNIPTTSNTTGSLIVTGGIGVSGNVYSTGSQSVFRGNVNIGNVVTNSNYTLDAASSSNDTTVRSFTSAAGAWFMAYSTSGYYAGVKYVGANGARNWFSGMGNNNQAYTIAMSIDSGSNRFFTIDTTGYISLAGAPGSESFRATPIANSVNYLQIAGSATGLNPTISVAGTDSNITMAFQQKGTGNFQFNGSGTVALQVFTTPLSSVNYFRLSPALTNNPPTINALGSDTNVGLRLSPQGTGSVIVTGPMTVANTVNAVSQFAVSLQPNFNTTSTWANTAATFGGIASGGSAAAAAVGIAFDSTNGGTLVSVAPGQGWYNMRYWAQQHTFATTGSTQFNISNTGSAVNYLQVTGGAANNEPLISAQGSDTNVSLALQSKGTGGIDFAAGADGVNISNGNTVTSLKLTSIGSGYTTVPTITITAPTTTGGVTATANVFDMGIWGVGVSFGGTGYSANDVLTLVGGTVRTSAVTLKVTTISANVITGVTVLNYGSYSALPTNPITVTGGTGANATVNATWCVYGTTLLTSGSGYVEQPTVTFSTGGGAVAALAYATVGSNTSIKGLGTQLNLQTANNQTSIQLLDDSTTPISNTALYVIGASSSLGRLGLRSSKALYMSSGSSNPLGFFTNGSTTSDGSPQLNITHTASVNYLNITGGATNGAPVLSAAGSDTNVSIFITPKGTGNVTVTSTTAATSPTAGALVVSGGIGVAGAVVHGAGTVSSPSVAIGAGNRGFYNPTGGDVGFVAGGWEQVRYLTTTPSVNYLTMTGANTASAPIISVAGSDTDITLNILAKNNASVNISNGNGLAVRFYGGINYLNLAGSGSGAATAMTALGSDANVSIYLTPKGTGNVTVTSTTASTSNTTGSLIVAGGLGVGGNTYLSNNLTIVSTGGYLNTLQYSQGYYSTLSYFGVTGTGSFAGMQYNVTPASGGASHYFTAYGSPTSQGQNLFSIGTAPQGGTSVNYLGVTSNTTGNAPVFSAFGSDTNISLNYDAKGSGFHYFRNQSGNIQFAVGSSTSAVDYFVMRGSNIGFPVMEAQGTSTNIGLTVSTKGTGGLFLKTGNVQQVQILNTPSAVNFLSLTGAVTTGAPELSAQGSDANVSIFITPKGTGNVTVTSTTASTSNTTGALVVSGGLGVSGNVYAGTIYASGAQLTTRPAVVVYSMIFGGS